MKRVNVVLLLNIIMRAVFMPMMKHKICGCDLESSLFSRRARECWFMSPIWLRGWSTCSFGQKWWSHLRHSKIYLSRLTRWSIVGKQSINGPEEICNWDLQSSPSQLPSTNCCMAQLLSQQDDFVNQESMLESFIKGKGHLCLFLP